MHILPLKCPHGQSAFLKFTSCDNQTLEGMYSNSCCSCSFELEIIKISQSSHTIYSNKILNFQESTPILNACTKKNLETYQSHHIPLYFLSIGDIVQKFNRSEIECRKSMQNCYYFYFYYCNFSHYL